MAQAASKRGVMQPQLRPTTVMYDDDEPSSMSLELFGYHGGGVVDGDGAALSLQLAFDDDSFKHGGGCGGDYYGGSWAGYGGSGGASSSSSSSVLSFEQAGSGGGGHHHLAYGDDGCALWMDAAAGMVEHPAQQHGSVCRFGLVSPGSSADDDAGLHFQELGSVQPPAKATNKRGRPVISYLIKSSPQQSR
jgi:hypothetical protein